MPIITLPDGNNLTFPDKVTGLDVAEKISKSLAKQAMVISVDGDLDAQGRMPSLSAASTPWERRACATDAIIAHTTAAAFMGVKQLINGAH